MSEPMVVDPSLIHKIERANADILARSTRAHGGALLEIAGGLAAFNGDGNPLTQCIGMGIDEELTASDFERVLAFFRGRCQSFEFKLSPMSLTRVRELILPWALTISEFEVSLVRELDGSETFEASWDIRPITEDFHAYALRSSYRFSGDNAPPGIVDVITASVESGAVEGFEVYEDGEPIAGCGYAVCGDVAYLVGASVLPQYRGRGIHKALQAFRIARAAHTGCRYAVQGAMLGSVSQQNANKNGFVIASVAPTFLLKG